VRRQAAGCAPHTVKSVDHEYEHAKLALHDLRQPGSRNVSQFEFTGEAFACGGSLLVAVALRDAEGTPQQRNGATDLRRERTIGRNPPAGAALKGFQPRQADPRLSPRKPALADEQKWVCEVIKP